MNIIMAYSPKPLEYPHAVKQDIRHGLSININFKLNLTGSHAANAKGLVCYAYVYAHMNSVNKCLSVLTYYQGS